MASTAVELVVKLKALDKLSKPLQQLNNTVQSTNSRLQALKKRQAEIADYKKLSQSLNDTGGALAKAQKNAKALQQQLISVQAPTAKMKQEYTKARQEVHKLSEQQKRQTQTLNQAKNALQQAGVPTNNLAAYNAKLSRTIASANSHLDKQTAKVKKLAEQEAKIQSLKEKHGKSMQHMAMIGASGYAAMNVGKRGLTLGANVIAPGLEFDKEMSNVQALARLDKNDPAMQALRAQAQQLGAETSFTSADAARGQAFLAMAGYTPEAIKAAMPALLNTALAGDLDLGRAADIVSDIAGAFSMDASQTGNISDILSLTFTTSNTNLEQLAETMKYVAPVAKTAGLSLEKVSAMSGLLANAGIKGSESGTVLRAMILRLSAPTGAAAKELEQMGVKTKDAYGNIKDMPTLLKDIAWATEKMGSGDKLAALKNIFGERPAAGIAKLLEHAGADDLAKYIDQISTQYEGAAQKIADTKMDNLVGDLKGMQSAWENIGIVVNEEIGPSLRDATTGITTLLREVAKWMKDNKELTATIIKFLVAAAAIITVLGALTFAFAAIAGPIKVLIFSLRLLGVTTALAVSPIYIALLLLAVAAYLIYKNWEPIKAFFIDLWNSITPPIIGAWETVKGTFTDGIEWVFNKIETMKTFFSSLPQIFADFGRNLVSGFIGGIGAMMDSVKQSITGLGDSAVGWFKEKLGINSPSRVFAELGVNTLEGYNQGLDKEQRNTVSYLADFSKKITATAAGITFATGIAAAPISASNAQAMAAPSAGDNITINVYAQQGQSAQDIAAEIERVLAQRERRQAVRQGSRLGD